MSTITCGKTAANGIVITMVVLAVAWLGSSGAPVTPATGPTVKTEGIIISVDPDASSFTVSGPQGTQEFDVTSDTVIDLGGTEHIAFDALQRFVGVDSIVLSADTGAQQNARSVTLLVMPARATTQPGARDHAKPVGAIGGGHK